MILNEYFNLDTRFLQLKSIKNKLKVNIKYFTRQIFFFRTNQFNIHWDSEDCHLQPQQCDLKCNSGNLSEPHVFVTVFLLRTRLRFPLWTVWWPWPLRWITAGSSLVSDTLLQSVNAFRLHRRKKQSISMLSQHTSQVICCHAFSLKTTFFWSSCVPRV